MRCIPFVFIPEDNEVVVRLGRFSDLLPKPDAFPVITSGKWTIVRFVDMELTAAGTVTDLHRIPF